MTVLTEGKHTAEFIITEVDPGIGREVVTLAANSGDLSAGTILGRKRGAVTSAAVGTNAGNGALGTVTLGAGAKEGDYKLVIVEPGSDAGKFMLEDPSGAVIGHGTVGSAFSGGGLAFTLADGSNDFVAGDTIKISVAVGTKWAPYDAAGTDGTEIARGILYDNVADSAADQNVLAIVRHTVVIEDLLTGSDASAKAALKEQTIIYR